MPRQTREATRRAILVAAYELFYRKGYARVGVDEIAALAKVTKRTLYYHFRSKDDLLAEVLNWQAQLATVHIRKYENNISAGDGRKFVTTLFSEVKKWSAKPRWSGSGMTRLAMELADLPGHPARHVARRHKEDVQAWIAEMLAKVGVRPVRERAKEIQLLLEGAGVLTLITGDRGYSDIAAKAARRLLRNRYTR
jgi:AcrR family transcriptional regulator